MDNLPERKEVSPVEHTSYQRTYTFVSERPGWLIKAVALAVAATLLALALIFSLVIFLIAAGLALIALAYRWRSRWRARRPMRAARRK